MDAIDLLEKLRSDLFRNRIELEGYEVKDFTNAIKEIESLYSQIEDSEEDD